MCYYWDVCHSAFPHLPIYSYVPINTYQYTTRVCNNKSECVHAAVYVAIE